MGFAYRHGQEQGQFRADPWAEYALLSVAGDRLELAFRRVPYDPEALFAELARSAIAIYRASGRPFTDEAIAQYSAR